MIDINFTWTAEVWCLDVGDLTNVVQKMFWKCTASTVDGATSLNTVGNIILGNPKKTSFVSLNDINSDVIRSWVPNHEEIESNLLDKVNIAHHMPEPFVVSVPLTEE